MKKTVTKNKRDICLKNRIKNFIMFALLLGVEIVIGRWGTGIVRNYIGDVLVIPTIYFFLRMTFFGRDSGFSVYVLPLITFMLGGMAEIVQMVDFNGIFGIPRDSLLGILVGNVFDLRDILCYFVGLLLIGLYLLIERKGLNE